MRNSCKKSFLSHFSDITKKREKPQFLQSFLKPELPGLATLLCCSLGQQNHLSQLPNLRFISVTQANINCNKVNFQQKEY